MSGELPEQPHGNFTLISYQKDNLQELVASAILQNRRGMYSVQGRKRREDLLQNEEIEAYAEITIFGMYFTPEQLHMIYERGKEDVFINIYTDAETYKGEYNALHFVSVILIPNGDYVSSLKTENEPPFTMQLLTKMCTGDTSREVENFRAWLLKKDWLHPEKLVRNLLDHRYRVPDKVIRAAVNTYREQLYRWLLRGTFSLEIGLDVAEEWTRQIKEKSNVNIDVKRSSRNSRCCLFTLPLDPDSDTIRELALFVHSKGYNLVDHQQDKPRYTESSANHRFAACEVSEAFDKWIRQFSKFATAKSVIGEARDDDVCLHGDPFYVTFMKVVLRKFFEVRELDIITIDIHISATCVFMHAQPEKKVGYPQPHHIEECEEDIIRIIDYSWDDTYAIDVAIILEREWDLEQNVAELIALYANYVYIACDKEEKVGKEEKQKRKYVNKRILIQHSEEEEDESDEDSQVSEEHIAIEEEEETDHTEESAHPSEQEHSEPEAEPELPEQPHEVEEVEEVVEEEVQEMTPRTTRKRRRGNTDKDEKSD